MAVRSDTLATQHSGATPTLVIYQVPAGVTTLLKDVRMSVTGSSASTFAVSVRRGGVKVAVLSISLSGLAGSATASTTGFMVLEPNDQITLDVGGGASPVADVWCSGAELQGLAP